jgi:CheY-like chemotaxis protein
VTGDAQPPASVVVAENLCAPAEVQDGDKRTVLYIEDNLSNMLLVEEVLTERPDLKLLSSLEGLSGLEMARACKPDLILLDVHLPDLPGDAILRMLKEDGTTREIPSSW